MYGSPLDNWGKAILVFALLAGIGPLLFLGRTLDPSTQALQDAKGSWVPKAMMNDQPAPFWIAAVVLGVIGLLLLGVDRWLDRRKRRLERLRRERLG